MSNIIRMISKDGTITVMAGDTTDMVNRAADIHKSSAVITAAMGRLMTAASFMGDMLKGEDDSVTLRLNGNGPSGVVIAVSDSSGNARCYVSNPVVEIPLNAKGKLDVSGAVGKDGTLTVMKDLGLKEPYIGQIPLVSGEIAEDVTSYFAVSEQTPTVCALGVLVNPDLSVKAAGGFIIQLLPTADDSVIDEIEKCLEGVEPVTAMLSRGMTPESICRHVLKTFDLELLDESETEYRCNCSKKRVENALISMGKDDLASLLEDEVTEVKCHFCEKKYTFDKKDIQRLLREIK